MNDNWIMVKKCLPEKSIPVIIRTAEGRIYKGMYYNSHGKDYWSAEQPYWSEIKNVIAWIPMPKVLKMYIWARLGIEIEISPEEASVIFGEDEKASSCFLQEKIRQGKFKPSGDSYIPSSCIAEFDKRYGTDYADECDDVCFEIEDEINNKEEEK